MAKLPAFQFYPGDWRRDVALQRCSIAARGVWLELMCLMHDGVPYGHLATEQGSITDPRVIGRLIGCTPREVTRALEELNRGGVCSVTEAGVLYSRRMVRDQAARDRRAAAGARGAEHGSKGAPFGVLGGRPRKRPSEPPVDPPIETPIGTGLKPPPAFAVASAVLSPRLSRKKDSDSGRVSRNETARRCLEFLNQKTGRTYRPVPVNLDLLVARLAEGATEANIRGVIARKCQEWQGTDLAKFLRPATLFNRTKFEQYLGERRAEVGDGALPPVP